MKSKLTIAIVFVFVIASSAEAWESHYAAKKFDENGDMRFNSEHAQLTKQSMEDLEWIDTTFNELPECGEVKDFNSDLLGWSTLRTRTFCPPYFSELPDFFYSVEDYINQGKKCPPFNEWIVGDCHNFSHFMGALNSNHFPPQLKTNYEKYHSIALALRDMHLDLKEQLKNNSEYEDFVEECAMEALTYESIAQHYNQDQWSMGHMWHRWGSPDINDFPVFTTDNSSSALLRRTNAAYGTVIGAVSGMIHGWRSTVEEAWGNDLIFEGDDYFAAITKYDPMCYYTDGVEWRRPLSSSHYPGTGDLFLDEQYNQDIQGDFYEQSQELGVCSRNSLRELYDKDFEWQNYDDCWNNFATNRAMYIGLGEGPSSMANMALKIVSKATDNLADSSFAILNDILDGANREMVRLSTIFEEAARNDPFDTYLAEGYATKDRDPDKRLKLFTILPNDAYNKYPSYADPARNAPGDPADADFAKKIDNELFGVRQVKYFNKCHAELYCDDPSILQDYRQKCESGSDLDCQICGELAARFFIGEPPICEILAPGINPDPGNQNPPKTLSAIRTWCGEIVPPLEFPVYYKGTSTFTDVTGSASGIMRFSAYESGSVALNYKGEDDTFYQSVYGNHENGSFTIVFNSSFSVSGTFDEYSVSCSGSNQYGGASFSGTRVDFLDFLDF